MNKSETPSLAKPFSHIYLEEEASDYPLAKRLLAHFSDAVTIPIRHYKDVFNRGHQDFCLQKQSPALILAVNHNEKVYPGARFCQSFGYEHFYYCSNLFNCIYDCEYCYLQGMYPSGNIVVFVNYEDTFHAVEQLLQQHPVYLCVSYDTDLLALEKLLGLTSLWIEFTKKHPALTIEIRTKSAYDFSSSPLPVCDRVIYAWTLSTPYVISHFEHHTPSLSMRLQALQRAMDQGHRVRLCFDPMLDYPGWKNELPEFYKTVFSSLQGEILDASIGVFRISGSYLKGMRKKRICAITCYPYTTENGWSSYETGKTRDMLQTARKLLSQYLPEERIFESTE